MSSNKKPTVGGDSFSVSQGTTVPQTDGVSPEVVAYIDRRFQEMDARQVDLLVDITGLFDTVSSAPTQAPANIFDQIKIYKNGTTYRLYWYDAVNNQWRYATGT